MSTKYRFRIETSGGIEEMNPLYEDLDIVWTESKEYVFFRKKLTSKLIFMRGDFDKIMNSPFDHTFIVYLDRLERGESWELEIWKGLFNRTDCEEIDEDEKRIVVSPLPFDNYKKILEGIEKELDLIQAAPDINEVQMYVRSMLQVYVAGSSVITNILGDTTFEQSVSFPTFDDVALTNDYHFIKGKEIRFVPGDSASGGALVPDVSGYYNENLTNLLNTQFQFVRIGQGFYSANPLIEDPNGDSGGLFTTATFPLDVFDDFLSVWETSDGKKWEFISRLPDNEGNPIAYDFRPITGGSPPNTGTLTHISGGVTTGVINYTNYSLGNFWRWGIWDNNINDYVYISDRELGSSNNELETFSQGLLFKSRSSNSKIRIFTASIYMRYLTNETTVNGNNTQDIPEDDIVSTSSRYSKVIGIDYDGFAASDRNSTEPNIYGRIHSEAANFANNYFIQPSISNNTYPIAKSEWSGASFWFYYDTALRDLVNNGSSEYTLKTAYKLSSCIHALLQLIDPSITHEENEEHSKFLYGNVPVRGGKKYPMITPKSNVIAGQYDKPATKAKIRLSNITNFIKDFYNGGWHVDEQNRLVIEHISFYENGMSYDGLNVGVDLTNLIEPKTKKKWSYKKRKYNFAKSDMPELIKHKWMDEVTDPFVGFDLEILSSYVQKGNFDERNLSIFTSDVDFIHANDEGIGQSGFVFLETVFINMVYKVPTPTIIAYPDGYELQNGYASMIYAHRKYWRHNLPAPNIKLNFEPYTALSVKRNKVQNIDFPFNKDFDPMKLVVSLLGAGKVKSPTADLLTNSIKITLHHGTE